MNEGQEQQRLDLLLSALRHALGHGLPTQFVAVQGLLRLLELEQGDRLDAEGRDYLRRAVAAAERAQALVGALNEVVRAWQEDGCPQPVDLAALAEEVGNEFKYLYPDLTIEYDFPVPSPLWRAPRTVLRKLIVQVASRCVPTAPADRTPRLGIGARSATGRLEVWVADLTSQPPDQQQQPPETAAGGLILAEQLAASCGARLRVHSEPGRGTVYTLTAGDSPKEAP